MRRMKDERGTRFILQASGLYPAGFRQDRFSSEHTREALMSEVVGLGQQMQRTGLGDRLGTAMRVELAVHAF